MSLDFNFDPDHVFNTEPVGTPIAPPEQPVGGLIDTHYADTIQPTAKDAKSGEQIDLAHAMMPPPEYSLITEIESSSLVDQIIAQLPPEVRAKIVSAPENQIEADRVIGVLGGILAAGAVQVDPAQVAVQKMDRADGAVSLQQDLYNGSLEALKNVDHPDKMVLLDFLGVIAKYTLEYRNELMQILFSDTSVSKSLSVAKRDSLNVEFGLLKKQISKNEKLYKKAASTRKAKFGAGIALMVLGAVATAIGVAATIAGFPAGLALVGVGIGLVTAGVSLYQSANGADWVQKLTQTMSDKEKDWMMAIGIAAFVVMTAVAIASAGAASPLLAVAGTAVGTGGAAVASSLWSTRAMELITNSLKDSQGLSAKDAAIASATIVAFLNVALVALTMGGASAYSNYMKTGSVFGKAEEGVPTQGWGQAAKGVVNDFLKGMRSMLNPSSLSFNLKASLQGLTGMLKGGVEGWLELAETLIPLLGAIFEGMTAIKEAEFTGKQGKVMEFKAIVDKLMILLDNAMQVYDNEVDQLVNNESEFMTQATMLSENYQNLVENLMRAVTAITSNQAAPQAAATGGGGMAPSTTEAVASVPMEGLESKMMGTTKPDQFVYLMVLMRTMGLKIADRLKKAGLSAKAAEGQGMKLAALILKQLSMISKGQLDMGKDAQEALAKNPVLLTLSMLLTERGADPFKLQMLFEASPQSTIFDDATLAELTKMLEQMSANNPDFQQLLMKFKQLINKKSDSPVDFSFEILKLFAAGLGMGKVDFSALKFLMGEEPVLSDLESSEEDLGSLVDEYFIRGSTGGYNPALSV